MDKGRGEGKAIEARGPGPAAAGLWDSAPQGN